jgi:HK97 family phage portal protein
MLDRLWRWLGLERRALDYADPALQRLYGDTGRTSAGEPVSVERAVGLTAVWACVNLIAGSIASMPLVLYKRSDDGRDRYTDHPLYDVLHTRPNPVQSVVAFWEAMVTALLLRGNAYALITRDDDARVRALWYVNPDRVHVEVLKTGRLRYTVATGGQTQTVPDTGMLHVPGPMSDDGYTGRSVIATFRETLGLGLALERYGAEFFSNAATPRGVLQAKGRLSAAAQDHIRETFTENHASRGRRHRTMILEEGLEYKPIALPHDEAQFIESRQFGVEEVARIFGVPPHMVGARITGGSSLTYSNVEMESLRLLKHTLGPWLTRIESAVNFACVPPLERRQMYVEYLPDALLAADTKGRYEAYEIALRNRILTVDEVRRKENLPALRLPERVPTVE